MGEPEKPLIIGFRPEPGSELERLGRDLIKVALAYRAEVSKTHAQSAVVWASYEGGELVIVTRAEYRDMLMEGIEQIP